MLIRAPWFPPPQRGIESRNRQGKKKCWAEMGCLCCQLPWLPVHLRLSKNSCYVMPGQEKELEAQEGVWKSARGTDALSLVAPRLLLPPRAAAAQLQRVPPSSERLHWRVLRSLIS